MKLKNHLCFGCRKNVVADILSITHTPHNVLLKLQCPLCKFTETRLLSPQEYERRKK